MDIEKGVNAAFLELEGEHVRDRLRASCVS